MARIVPHTCPRCGLPWPRTPEFWNRLRLNKADGLAYWCKVCTRNDWRKRDPALKARRVSDADARAQRKGLL